MHYRKMTGCLLLAALAAGCESTTAELPTAPGPADDAALSIVLTGPTSASAAIGSMAAEPGDEQSLPISAIESIRVVIDGVEVLPADGGPWRALDIVGGEGMEVDVLRLGEEPIVVATGDLPQGEYVDARLYVASAMLTLGQEVCLGASDAMNETQCLAAGDHEAWFPSAAQSGIKTDARFTIDEGGATEVPLVADPDATVRSAAWAPGLGRVIVAPVIRAGGAGE